MKDYFNATERDEYIKANHLIATMEDMVNKSNVYSKEETTNLKKAVTFGKKALNSAMDRQSESSKKSTIRMMKNTETILDYSSMIDVIAKKKTAKLTAAYHENKEYYDLVEAIFQHNCRNCMKCSNECIFYDQFELNYVPNYDGMPRSGSCKYSFKTI